MLMLILCELCELIFDKFEMDQDEIFYIEMLLFGFKYGFLIDVDIVMDVCFLFNLYYIFELKKLMGLDKFVVDYVMQ